MRSLNSEGTTPVTDRGSPKHLALSQLRSQLANTIALKSIKKKPVSLYLIFCQTLHRQAQSFASRIFIDSLARSVGGLWPKLQQTSVNPDSI